MPTNAQKMPLVLAQRLALKHTPCLNSTQSEIIYWCKKAKSREGETVQVYSFQRLDSGCLVKQSEKSVKV